MNVCSQLHQSADNNTVRLLSAYGVRGTVFSALHLFYHLLFTVAPRGEDHYFHLPNEETETQRGCATHTKSHSMPMQAPLPLEATAPPLWLACCVRGFDCVGKESSLDAWSCQPVTLSGSDEQVVAGRPRSKENPDMNLTAQLPQETISW